MSCLLLLRLILSLKKALSVEVNTTKVVGQTPKLLCARSNLLVKSGKCGLKIGCQNSTKYKGRLLALRSD